MFGGLGEGFEKTRFWLLSLCRGDLLSGFILRWIVKLRALRFYKSIVMVVGLLPVDVSAFGRFRGYVSHEK